MVLESKSELILRTKAVRLILPYSPPFQSGEEVEMKNSLPFLTCLPEGRDRSA